MATDLSSHVLDPQQWGMKAARLSEVALLGLPVPPGLCLNPTDLTSSPDEPARALNTWIELYRPQRVVVRTSAGEDLLHTAHAGRTVSLLNCPADPAALLQAITHELLPLGPEAPVEDGSILVQQQVEAPLYGVAFYGARHLSVEASSAPDGITSGTRPTVRAGATDRHITARWEQDMLPNLALVRRLGSLCSQLSEHFGFEVDVEWAWTGATVVVLQVRPVTRPLAGWAA
ncbi:pyruvate phosphate dikinase [Nocardiopsis sp. HNM0947]|uniref:Pyruvate phosphate dikinase n=1 Tax=Nocardiopsis coralli TaxID=2772213 RepID=A0ABR9P034_9ACTN|nr:pyruvate phosphate dikinase [Nocardiopsis coralli]MBE2997206.1 pyruvate phosphate dikinase [Nocardiopsis coralli]